MIYILVGCDDGTFGTNCSSTCGHCHKGQPCDKKTGACPKGCGPGYEGIYCNKCKISINFNSSFVSYIFKLYIFSMIFKHFCMSAFYIRVWIKTRKQKHRYYSWTFHLSLLFKILFPITIKYALCLQSLIDIDKWL